MTEPHIPHQKRPEGFALATRLYTRRNQYPGYSVEQLIRAADVEANRPPEYVQAALRSIQMASIQQQLQQQEAIARRKKLWLGMIASSVTFLGWVFWMHQSLTAAIESVDLAWHHLETQLNRQTDLVPSLIDATQASGQPERELAAVLAHTRHNFLSANTRMEKIAAAGELTKALKRFENNVIQNPQMRSNQQFAILQHELTENENRLIAKRGQYNHNVQVYNRQVQTLPNSLVAPMFGYEPKPFFETENAGAPVTMP